MLLPLRRLASCRAVAPALGQVRPSSNLPPLGKGIPGPQDPPSRGVNKMNAPSLGLVRLASVQLKGWLKMHMNDVCDDILRSAAQMGLRTSNTIGLPMRIYKYTVQRSPFVDKHSMEQFEKREYNRVIDFYGSSCTGPDATKVVHFLRHMERVIIPAHAAARAKVTLYSYERLAPAAPAEVRPADSPGAGAQSAAAISTSGLAAGMAAGELEAHLDAEEAAMEAKATVEAWEAAAVEASAAEAAAGAASAEPKMAV